MAEVRRALSAPALILLAACAGGLGAPPVPSPSEIPALEARFGASPTDQTTRLRLALAYRGAGRPADAVRLLEGVPAGQAAPAADVTLAGAYEDLERFAEARDVYRRLAETSPEPGLRREAARRLRALERLELRQAAREAVTQEDRLRSTPPAPEVVGVFPFLFGDGDPELRPLSRALSELLTVDLAQTDRLRVVERARVQLLLDELALGESGRADPATAARSGRLLGAGRIVQGRIDGEAGGVRLQALPVRVGAEPVQEPGDPLLREGQLARLFDMQKELALDLYAAMGIQLTAAERERIDRRRTQNLQALLAFGYGLEAMDAGQLQEALAWFDQARQLDPNFDLASDWRERADAEREWVQQDPHALYRIAVFAAGEADRFLDVELLIPNPGTRDALSEALGVEGLDRRGVLEIVIQAPGGGQ